MDTIERVTLIIGKTEYPMEQYDPETYPHKVVKDGAVVTVQIGIGVYYFYQVTP